MDILNIATASNLNTSSETLERLSYDEYWLVRSLVALNPNTPPETLDSLANDKAVIVRYWLARNPKTPQYLKDYLKIKDYFNCYGQLYTCN